MAHEIMGKDNMFSVNQVPWHELGIVLDEAPTIERAIIVANLDWEVGTKPLFTGEGTEVPALATFRKSDNNILGVVGNDYKVLQNKEAFSFFQPFVDSGEATLETAGSLRDGKRVWVLAKINRPDSVIVAKSDDRVSKYILLSNSHDGTLAVRVGFTPVRVVCSNTMKMAHASGESSLIRIRHAGDVVGNLGKVREIMDAANSRFEATAEQFRFLAKTEINGKDLEKYVKMIFATKKEIEEAGSFDKVTSGTRILGNIVNLFEKGRGNDMPGVKGTMWAAYNAVAEHLQYHRGDNTDTRLDSLWFGQGSSLNARALQTAIDFATLKQAA